MTPKISKSIWVFQSFQRLDFHKSLYEWYFEKNSKMDLGISCVFYMHNMLKREYLRLFTIFEILMPLWRSSLWRKDLDNH